ncbi:TylF/MycF/NovP-related O-methyltransferase [Brevundimonas sp.]|uniref:TylF/MycF/NovP-related O-methyltransferase n=1 Tax=Brevundimonas sp. TaxID=1871086 RepID=UPI00286A4A4A|nr:TylF/MycF/NovP-related O-methyltransferase [Brevundimonas sp.]
MASAERILAVVHAVDYVIKAGVAGDFVECGVYRGGCSMAAALTCLRAGQSDRTLHLFDTFEGMSPAGLEDVEADTERRAADLFPNDGKWCFADLDEVQRNMFRTDYPQARINMVKGRVEDTLPENAPDQIAVLRLDTDWYASTRHEMEHLYPRLARGGVLIVDDYGHWAGSRQAVDEYLAEHNIHLLLNRTDYTGRMALKP